LEDAIDTCGRVAAALHSSGITVGPRRAVEDELSELRRHVEVLERISPRLGSRFAHWLARVSAYAASSPPSDLAFGHGDFSYTQLIFAGTQCGLVDFDTVCQAEPSLDLGQFLAYLRVATMKPLEGPSEEGRVMADRLCARFVDAYIESAGERGVPEVVSSRAPLYELISLLRLAFHSWQKFKVKRLGYVMSVIEDRLSRLPT